MVAELLVERRIKGGNNGEEEGNVGKGDWMCGRI